MLTIVCTVLLLQMPGGMTHQQHMKDRGAAAMEFNQDAAVHHFKLARDGGSIEVEAREETDAATRPAIRAHLKQIAVQFANGDFSKPFMTHGENPPGSQRMAALRSTIKYRYDDTDRGGRVRIRSADAEAVKAVHEFLRYQIREHHTNDPAKLVR